MNAKVIGESWSAAGSELAIVLGGWPGHVYTLRTYKDARISGVDGGEYDPRTRSIRVTIPAGSQDRQTNVTVHIRLELKPS